MKKFLIVILLGVLSIHHYSLLAQNAHNKEHIFKKPNQNYRTVGVLPVNDVTSTHTYLDGLGRPIQEVNYRQSPTEKDIVEPIVYNRFGEIPYDYLPYVSTTGDGAYKIDPLTQQLIFYTTPHDQIVDDSKPFTYTVYESSPFARVVHTIGAGEKWHNAPGEKGKITAQKRTNTVSGSNGVVDGDDVLIWELSTTNAIPTTHQQTYLTGTLIVEETTDEEGSRHIRYSNQRGQVLLKKQEGEGGSYLSTYFIYDQIGHLRYVLPPKAVESLSQTNWNITEELKSELVFYYEYDAKGRKIVEKIPSTGGSNANGETHFVYDQAGRLALIQAPNQRNQNKWNYRKYDAFDRLVFTGIYTSSDARSTLQTAFDQALTLHVRIPTSSERNHPMLVLGYIDEALPANANTELLSVLYYDQYDIDQDGSSDANFTLPVGIFTENSTDGIDLPSFVEHVRGKTVASKVKVLGESTWLSNYLYYNEKGELSQKLSTNHLGGQDFVTYQYDFSGHLIKSYHEHTKASGILPITTLKEYTYDHIGRLKEVFQQVDGGKGEAIVQYFYNELGQLTSKALGKYLQSVDYSYDIRGELTKINDADLTDQNDFFGMELDYSLNGNVVAHSWKGQIDDNKRVYEYSYDKLNRLVDADYSNSDNPNENFDAAFSYDIQGNIQTLKRHGLVDEASGVYGLIDDLTYIYDKQGQSNRLIKIKDEVVSNSYFSEDFREGGGVNQSYAYDINGNLTRDDNKGISIRYNHMNLVSEINYGGGNFISYKYNASGDKLSKLTYANGIQTQTTDYLGNFVYQNGTLNHSRHEEGRVIYFVDNTHDYEYHYKDHLGNLRMAFREAEATATATMEIANDDDEREQFDNIIETRIWSHNNALGFARTGTAAAQLNGSNQNKTMGPATALAVKPGDKITVTAYSKYTAAGPYTTGTATFPLFGATNDFGLEGNPLFGLGGGVQFSPVFLNLSSNYTPFAYVMVRYLDENGNELSYEYERIDIGRNSYQEINLYSEVEHEGYAVIYVANESRKDVYFDDIHISHKQVQFQENQYYPFGLTIKPLEKQGLPDDKFQFNGKEKQVETGWTDFGPRMYNAQIGRWNSIDPLGNHPNQLDKSPYAGMWNNPVSINDPDGKCPECPDGLYTIEPGDTFWDLEERWGLDHGTLQAWNSKLNPKSLQVGATIIANSDIPVNAPFDVTTEIPAYRLEVRSQSSNTMAVPFVLATALVADDLTVIGVADDPLLIPVGLWLGAALLYDAANTRDVTFEIPYTKVDIDPARFYYVTYTKTNLTTGQVYVGRSSGYATDPASIVALRDGNHHMSAKGFTTATLSTFAPATKIGGYSTRALDPAYWAIRGSEQLQIEAYRRLGISGNSINGIGPNNRNISKYIQEAIDFFGFP